MSENLVPYQQIVSSSSVTNAAEVLQEHPYSVWYETEEGRSALAEDRRFFREQFGASVIATRRDSRITITGQAEDKGISVTYPQSPRDKEVSISVLQHGAAILRMHCELPYRKISFTAALAAVQAL